VLWETGHIAPDVFSFLSQHRDASLDQLADVLQVDMVCRWATGIPIAVERYFRHLPELDSEPHLKRAVILCELQHRFDAADHTTGPALDELRHRFPDLEQAVLEDLLEQARCLPRAAHDDPTRHSCDMGTNPALAERTELHVGGAPAALEFGDPQFEEDDGTLPLRKPDHDAAHADSALAAAALAFDSDSEEAIEFLTLDGLQPDVRNLLESAMTERTFAQGAVLIQQGESGTSLFLMQEGMVEISSKDLAGDSRFIARSGPGEILGEMALLTNEPRSATVVALTPVRALELLATQFHQLARQHPVIGVVLTRLVATRLGRAERDALADKTLGGYRIRTRLGRGGMAIVYEAQDVQSGQRVALKMMSHRLGYDPAALKLFQREADTIQTFDHENIIRTLGRFEAFHTYFIVMEYCDGVTLDDVIRTQGPIPESLFRKVLGQIAAGLDFAHRSGIIHRDIKPSNVMITRDGVVKLMDFGLAQPLDDSEHPMATHIVGTPAYMAPEQLAGAPVSKEADYFSLGCTAFKMLAGEKLLPESDVQKLRRLHRSLRITTDDLKRRCPGISEPVIRLIHKCLQPNPKDRQPNIQACCQWAECLSAQELERWMDCTSRQDPP